MMLLEFDRVCKTLRRRGPDHVVLQDVSFAVEEGQWVSILGESGAGKSMLLQIAAGQDAPDDGTVRFAEQDLYALRGSRRLDLLVDTIGWARDGPSTRMAVSISVFLAMTAPPKLGRRGLNREIDTILEAVGLSEFADASWDELTASELRRASLANALIRRPRLLLADDPFLGADVLQREQLQLLLRSWVDQQGLTILHVTSEAAGTLQSDRVMALSRGSIIKPSPPAPADVIDFPTRESRSA